MRVAQVVARLQRGATGTWRLRAQAVFALDCDTLNSWTRAGTRAV